MIIVYIMGGIGNQLFQYAAGRRLAHKLNTELKLDLCQYDFDNLHPYALNLFNIQASVATPEEIERCKQFSKENGFGIENTNYNFMPEVLDYPDNVWLYGYWQNERYFADIADILRKELTLKYPLGVSAQYWKEKIIDAECSVSLHFRHGDFIYSPINVSLSNHFAVPPLDYYYNCINMLKQHYRNLTLFVFSNNLQWVKENLRSDIPIEFVEGEDLKDVEELYLMSLCKHNVIPKSTFSWWGAWLNQNPDKKVFIPALIEGNTPLNTPNNKIIPDNWIEVPFDFNAQPSVTIRPYFSVLLVVNNSVMTIAETLLSILEQDYKYYEVIIIDNASTDGSGKVCRQVDKGCNNVTLIKLYQKVQNGAAWNMALNVAQGYYVLFLKSDDRILSDALNYLYLMNEHIVADIVNSVSYFKENKNGNIEFADKKFVLKTMPSFENLKGVFRDKLNKLTLLKVLANNEVFPPLETMLFKRKFLTDNKIKFNEELEDNSEFLFTLDAMFQTDEIIFTPNPCYIAPKS